MTDYWVLDLLLLQRMKQCVLCTRPSVLCIFLQNQTFRGPNRESFTTSKNIPEVEILSDTSQDDLVYGKHLNYWQPWWKSLWKNVHRFLFAHLPYNQLWELLAPLVKIVSAVKEFNQTLKIWKTAHFISFHLYYSLPMLMSN